MSAAADTSQLLRATVRSLIFKSRIQGRENSCEIEAIVRSPLVH